MSRNFYLYSSSAVYSGAEKMLLALAQAISKLSSDNHVYLNYASDELFNKNSEFIYKVNKISNLEKISASPIKAFIYLLSGFKCFFKRDLVNKNAILVFNDLESLINNWPAALFNRSFFYLHDSHKVEKYKARAVCWLISLLVDQILVITKARVNILKRIGIQNTIYFPNCVINKPATLVKNINQREVHCLCVAQIAKWKRIDKVIELFKILAEIKSDKQWFLHICGRPDKNDQEALVLESDIVKHSFIDTRIIYHGYEPDLSSLWQQSQFLISMSENEPFGLALVEALQYGCYVISAEGEGPEEILSGSIRNGLLIADIHDLENWVRKNQYNIIHNYNDTRLSPDIIELFSFEKYLDRVNAIFMMNDAGSTL